MLFNIFLLIGSCAAAPIASVDNSSALRLNDKRAEDQWPEHGTFKTNDLFEHPGSPADSPATPNLDELNNIEKAAFNLPKRDTLDSFSKNTRSIIGSPKIGGPKTAKLNSNWKCNGFWTEDGRQRISFKFQGFCEDKWGQCFLEKVRSNGIQPHNWQAWDLGDGWWQVDLSINWGMSQVARNAIVEYTHINIPCW